MMLGPPTQAPDRSGNDPARAWIGPFRALLLLLAAAAATVHPAAAQPLEVTTLERPVSLAGSWRFQPGSDATWAAPELDDAAWAEIEVPGPWGSQGHRDAELAWYRRTLRLAPAALGPEPRLGLTVGEVASSYRLYAGGVLLGGVGELPPEGRQEYDRHRTYAVPAHAIEPDGRLVLALAVWRAPAAGHRAGGITGGPLELGRLEDVTRRAVTRELPQLVLAAVFALIGLYHLQLYRRRPQLSVYFWYALVALNDAAFTFLSSQWRFLLGDSFIALKEAEYLARYLLPALFIQFLWPMLSRPIGRWLRLYQLSHVALAALVVATPGLDLNLITVRIWSFWVLPTIALAAGLILWRARAGDPEAHTLAFGGLVTCATFLNDIAVGQSLWQLPSLSPYGFAAFVLAMGISLSNRFTRVYKQLDRSRIELEERVARRTRQLDDALHAAEAGSRAKSQFLANISHEIRTPMNGVIGLADVLLLTELTPEQRRHLRTIGSSGRALMRVLDDVLELSELENGAVELAAVAFDLRRETRGILDLLAPTAVDKGIELALEWPEDLPTAVRGDPARLRQILLHLIGNAVKFTDSGGVTVKVERRRAEGERLRLGFEIRDTGIGFDATQLPRLCEAFTQADASHRRRHGGAGLGLRLAHELVERMGGHLEAESIPGEGSTFRFEVPLAAATL